MLTKSFGRNNGVEIKEAILENKNNHISIISYGAITKSWIVSHGGKEVPILLGFDSLAAYKDDKNFIGIIAGRVANRIKAGYFKIADNEYQLALNDYPNHLHGGKFGFGKKNWNLDVNSDECSVRLSRVSPHMEEGYPGNVIIHVTVTLNEDSLSYEMWAKPDRPTPINLAQHNYYNLLGQGNIWSHRFESIATNYTPVDAHLIPDGQFKNIGELSYGFSKIVNNGGQATITELDPEKKGIDINLVLGDSKGVCRRVAKMVAGNGLSMEVFTDELGLQFYTGGNLSSNYLGHMGSKYRSFEGFCLEPQSYPASINIPSFPSVIYTPDNPYRQKTTIKICSRFENTKLN